MPFRETDACTPARQYVSQLCARVREKRTAGTRGGHRECFIFSGLSNRRGRYMHALAAINDLISVSFHLPDYGQYSGVLVGRVRQRYSRTSRTEYTGRGGRYEVERAAPVFHRGSRLIIAFSRITFPGSRQFAACV